MRTLEGRVAAEEDALHAQDVDGVHNRLVGGCTADKVHVRAAGRNLDHGLVHLPVSHAHVYHQDGYFGVHAGDALRPERVGVFVEVGADVEREHHTGFGDLFDDGQRQHRIVDTIVVLRAVEFDAVEAVLLGADFHHLLGVFHADGGVGPAEAENDVGVFLHRFVDVLVVSLDLRAHVVGLEPGERLVDPGTLHALQVLFQGKVTACWGDVGIGVDNEHCQFSSFVY